MTQRSQTPAPVRSRDLLRLERTARPGESLVVPLMVPVRGNTVIFNEGIDRTEPGVGRHALNAVVRPREVRFVVGDEDELLFPVPVTDPDSAQTHRRHPFVDGEGAEKPVSVISYAVRTLGADYTGGEALNPDLGELALDELTGTLAAGALAVYLRSPELCRYLPLLQPRPA